MDNSTPDADAFLSSFQASDTPDADSFLQSYQDKPDLGKGLTDEISKHQPQTKPDFKGSMNNILNGGNTEDRVSKFAGNIPGFMIGEIKGVEDVPLGVIQTGTDVAKSFLDTIGYGDSAVGRGVQHMADNANAMIEDNDKGMLSNLPGYKTGSTVGQAVPMIAIGTELFPFSAERGVAALGKNLMSAAGGSATMGFLEPQDRQAGDTGGLDHRVGSALDSGETGTAAQLALSAAGKVGKTAMRLFKPDDYINGDVAGKALKRFNNAIFGSKANGEESNAWADIADAADKQTPLTSAQASGDIGLLGAEQNITKEPIYINEALKNQRERATLFDNWTDKSKTQQLLDFAKSDTNQQLKLVDATEQTIDQAIQGNKVALLKVAKNLISDPRAEELYSKYGVTPEDITSLANNNTAPSKPEFAQKFFDLLDTRKNELRDFKNATYDQFEKIAPHEMISMKRPAYLAEKLGQNENGTISDAINRTPVTKYLTSLRDENGQIAPISLSTANSYLKQINSDISNFSQKIVPGESAPYNTVEVLKQLKDTLETSIRNGVQKSGNSDLRAAYKQLTPVYKEYAGKVLNVDAGGGFNVDAPTRNIIEQASQNKLVPGAVLKEQYFTGNPTHDEVAIKSLNNLFTDNANTKLPKVGADDLDNVHNQIAQYGLADLKDSMGSEPSRDKFHLWAAKYQGVINNVPQLKQAVTGLYDKFSTGQYAYDAQLKSIEQAQTLLKNAKDSLDKSQLVKLAKNAVSPDGTVDTATPIAMVGGLLKSQTNEGFNNLVENIGGNRSALEGLKSTIAEYLDSSLTKDLAQGNVLNPTTMRRVIDEYNPVFNKIAGSGLYTDQELASLQQAKDLIVKASAGKDIGAGVVSVANSDNLINYAGTAATNHWAITNLVRELYSRSTSVKQANTAFLKMLVDPEEAIRIKNIAEQPTMANIHGAVSDLLGFEANKPDEKGNTEMSKLGVTPPPGVTKIDPKAIDRLKKEHDDGTLTPEDMREFDRVFNSTGASQYILRHYNLTKMVK